MTAPTVPAPQSGEPDMVAWDLVELAQGGDRDAFGQLYERYVNPVFRFVLYRVGDRSLAEDLTSETFLRALHRIHAVCYRGRDVGAWFVTIARNLVIDHMTSSRHRLERSVGDAALGSWVTDRTPEMDALAGEVGVVVVVRRCLERLSSADQFEVVVLRFLCGLSVAETAVAMGRGVGAVRQLQHRAVVTMAAIPEIEALRG